MQASSIGRMFAGKPGRLVTASMALVLFVILFPYMRFGLLFASHRVAGYVCGDEGEADTLVWMGRLGGHLEREHLINGLRAELAGKANDQVILGYISGIVASGRGDDIWLLARYAEITLAEPGKEYVFLMMIYGIQELGQVRFSERVRPSRVVGEGFDRFGIGKGTQRLTEEEKERLRLLAASFRAWWGAQRKE